MTRAEAKPPLVLCVGFRAGIVRAAERLGVVLAVIDRKAPLPALRPRLLGHAVHEWTGPPAELLEVATALVRDRPVAAVLALTEGAVLPAAQLREAFGAPGSSVATAERCADKRAMKAAMRAAGIPCAPYVELGPATRAEQLVDTLGLPIVFKKGRSSGSRGQCIARDIDTVRREMRGRDLAEGFVRGVEMSVEGFLRRGELCFTSTTEYLVPLHANIVPSSVPTETAAELAALLRRATCAVGLGLGVVHMEVFLTPAGVVFGELAARPPGGRLMPLMQRVYGFDPYEALLRIVLDREVEFPSRPRRFAGTWILHPGAGIVTTVVGLDVARSVPGVREVLVRVAPGDVVPPRLGSGQDVGHIDAEGATRDDVAHALERAHAALAVCVTPERG